MLKSRVITAIVLATFFLVSLFCLPAETFTVVMALVITYAAWEWSALADLPSVIYRWLYVAAIAVSLWLIDLWLDLNPASLFENHLRTLLSWACGWWALALLWIQGYPSSVVLWGRHWVCALMGFVVLVPTWVALAALMHIPNGDWLVLSVILVVALADIGAYFCGRAFGRHKLAVRVSPGKTWEGLLGGVSAILLATILYVLVLAESGSAWWAWLLLASVTGLASVVGDLLESMVKRYRGVKDSGSILPGHGGVLDRIDGITAALPVFALMYALLHERLS